MKWWLLAGLGLLLITGGVVGYRISQRGLDHLKYQEGFRSTAYKDQAGYWTIGYGHKILPNDSVSVVSKITKEKGEELLRQDLAIAEDTVNRHVDVPLTQGQYDALVSFVYNIGEPQFADSTALRRLNAGDYDGAVEAMQWFNKVTIDGQKQVDDILVNRREAERELWYA